MILPCYLHSIYIFASFTGYTNYIFKVISNLHVQESKVGRTIYKFGGKSLNKVELCRVHGVCFFPCLLMAVPLMLCLLVSVLCRSYLFSESSFGYSADDI